MAKRKYRMKKRAESQELTRQKIIDATVELHGSIGPKNTSISEVARRAGVRRLTVYRHFPDEFALFTACSTHWLSENPPPDPGRWMGIEDPVKRTSAALSALYSWYRGTQSMLRNVYRDLEEVEALHGPVQEFQGYYDAIHGDLVAAWHPKGRKPKPLEATVAHALAFSTWASLAGLGLSDPQITGLVVGWVEATAR